MDVTTARIAQNENNVKTSARTPQVEYGWEHTVQTIFDARLNLLRRQSALQQSLAIYSDPDDYRREGWASELAVVLHDLARIDRRLADTYEAAIFASDCGNCSPERQHPHHAHTEPCPCGCQRTVRLKEVRR